MCELRIGQSLEEERKAREKIKTIQASKRTMAQYKEGLRSKDIIMGIYKVSGIEDSRDSIGKMIVICQHC